MSRALRTLTALLAAALLGSPCAGAVTVGVREPARVVPLLAEPGPAPLPDDAAGPELHAQALRADPDAWRAVDGERVAWFDAVPLSDGSTVDLRMNRVDPFTADARIVEMATGPDGRLVERALPRPALSAWRGEVAGHPGSRAFLARSEAGLHGWIQFDGRTEIVSSGDQRTRQPILVSDTAWLPPTAFTCDTPAAPADAALEDPVAPAAMFGSGCRQLPVAVDTDQELLAKFTGTTAASAYVATIFAGLMDIYARDFDGRPAICYLRWWTTADPWTITGTTSGTLTELRDHWIANMGSVQRAIVMQACGRSLGGGIAWLSNTCASYGYAVMGSLKGSFPYPLLDNSSSNWDIIVSAHELGHVMSARHTHDLGLDDCWDPATGSLGACTQKATGTIMSYCHQCSGGYTNIALKFDATNVTSMISHVSSKSCTAPSVARPVGLPDTFAALQGRASTLDVLVNDLPSNCETVSIGGLPAATALGGQVSVNLTGAPGGGPAIAYAAPADATGTDAFTYTLTDASGQVSDPVQVTLDVRPVLPAFRGVSNDAPYLQVRLYDLTAPTALPDFTALTPFQYATVPALSYGSTTGTCVGSGRTDNVGAVFEGWLMVGTEGMHTLSLTSDAGSRLWVDGVLVVDHDGLHSYTEKTATAWLEAGRHAIRVSFFEATGSCGLTLKWAPPGTSSRVAVPWTSLSHGGQRFDLDGSGTVDYGDIATMLLDYGTECPMGSCYRDPNGQQLIGFDPPCGCPQDLDGSGLVDFGDIALLLMEF